jgi:hypothetical protein
MKLAHGPLIAGLLAANAAIMVSSGHAQPIPPAQSSAPGVSIAAPLPATPQTDAAAGSAEAPSSGIPKEDTEPHAYAPTDTLADCMSYWDAGTHMSKAEWRRTCQRTRNGTWAGD